MIRDLPQLGVFRPRKVLQPPFLVTNMNRNKGHSIVPNIQEKLGNHREK